MRSRFWIEIIKRFVWIIDKPSDLSVGVPPTLSYLHCGILDQNVVDHIDIRIEPTGNQWLRICNRKY